MRTPKRRLPHAFTYRAGIGLVGTNITCDATGFPSDLIFISHAHALGKGGPTKLAGERAGRRQIVATEQTLRLLGEAGNRLRSRALPAAFGRPFNLGSQRIEIVPSGYLPGAASLWCETADRRVFYVGAFAPEPLLPGVAPADMRHADAICVDATFGRPDLVFPPRRQVLAQVRGFVLDAIAERKAAVLLTSTSTLPVLALELVQAKIPVRAHQRFALELSRLNGVCEAIPAIARAPNQAKQPEALLWPTESWHTAALHVPSSARIALVSGSAAYPEIPARLQVEQSFPLTLLPTRDEILTAIRSSGSREVALFQGGAESLATDLRSLGFDAYPLGPPRQMTLVA